MSGTLYERTYTVIWADIDLNGHMRNTAYSEYGTHTRVSYLAAHGFTAARFRELGLGPVLLTEELAYRRELHLDDAIVVDFRMAGLAEDGSHWRVAHDLYHVAADGTRTLAAHMELDGGWLDLHARRLTRPPEALVAAFRALPQTEPFAVLRPLVR